MAEYIEREALIQKLQDEINSCPFYGHQFDLEDAKELIRNFPAADVAPVVRGRWVGSAFDMACSACGIYQSFHVGRTKFCPNCGADMREG